MTATTPPAPTIRCVSDGDFPDPFVLAHGGHWYAYATGGPKADGRALRLLVSDDFETWRPADAPLVVPDEGRGCSFWAPEVAEGDDGRFYLYYSFGREADQWHRLRVAVADAPEGPFGDAGVDLVDPARERFVIDPHPFRDADGAWWLFYARNFLDSDANGPHAGTALVCDRMTSMASLAGEEKVVLRARHGWTLFEANRRLDCYDASFDWHTLEGPFVRRVGDRYCLTFSGGNYTGEGYGVDVAWSGRIDGFYEQDSPEPALLSLAKTGLRGPGHHSITTGPDGRDWIAFHAWDAAMTRRQMHLAPLEWTDAGPRLSP